MGTEWVQKGSSCSLAAQSVAGIARAIYERTFRITGKEFEKAQTLKQ